MKTINSSLLVLLVVASSFARGEPVMPKHLDVEGFDGVIAQTGDVLIAGQPDDAGLTWAKAQGVTIVINLRTEEEMTSLDLDEPAIVQALGMEYIVLPLSRDPGSYTPDVVESFGNIVAGSQGKVLLHCGSARRASYLWAAHLYRNEGLSLSDAITHAKAANFGTLPLEGLLGEELTTLMSE
jgi:uncharacterized protein (TIGR01244 family)